jgi:hypothetical protein
MRLVLGDDGRRQAQVQLHRRVLSADAGRIVPNFHSSIGWNSTANDLTPSAPMSSLTWDELVGIAASSLLDSGLVGIGLDEVRVWHRGLGDVQAHDPPLIDDMPGLFEHLRSRGVLVSICTSDDRSSTDECTMRWNMSHLVDFSICGDKNGVVGASRVPEPCWSSAVAPAAGLRRASAWSLTTLGATSKWDDGWGRGLWWACSPAVAQWNNYFVPGPMSCCRMSGI